MRGRKWTEAPNGHGHGSRKTGRAHRRGHGKTRAAARMQGFPAPAEGRARPPAKQRMAAGGVHPFDLFSSYLSRLCDCGDQAAVALRDELTDPARMGRLGLRALGPGFARIDALAGPR